MDTNENTTDNSDFKDFVSNDGMTADSARKTGGGDEHTPHIDNTSTEVKPGAEYNINDQAHSQSSKEDFVKTVSNFVHEDGTKPPHAIDSKHTSNE